VHKVFAKYKNFIKDWSNQMKYIRWLWKHSKPFIPSLILLIGINIIITLTSVGMSIAGKLIIDEATLGSNIKKGIVIYIILILVGLILGGFLELLNVVVNEKFSFGIRRKVYRNILDTCWTEISQYHSGDLMTRLTSDINTIASGITYVIPSILTLLVRLIAAFLTLMYYDSSFAIFALILGPFAAIISIMLGKAVKKLQVKVQETEAAYRSYTQESISNIVIIKAFCGQQRAVERLNELRNERLYWIKKKQKTSVIASTAMNMAYYAGYMSAFAWGAVKLSTNSITYGTMSVFLSLVNQVQGPVVDLSKEIPQIISILASAGRVIEIENLPLENTKELPIQPLEMNLGINDLTFGYTREWIFQNTDIKIYSGEFVAIIGTSGIGKTTLIRLIMGFLTPLKGEITVIDEEGNELPITAGAREYMSYVPQGNTLMSGTIADNLRMGKPDATKEDMWKALLAASAEKFIRDMPEGVETKIGENGLGLSEGQAQRISIARALIRKVPLLILDEATSSLDEKTELEVLRNIRALKPSPTCILITHRYSVLQFCDRELEIKEGRILNYEC
jgi:ATP-binding cassette, subfamily B, bacterial